MKTSPNPRIHILKNPPGIDGELFEVDHYFYAAKHIGRYKLKHRYYAQINKRDTKRTAIEKLKKDTEQFIKKGRYSDYYYV